MNDSLDHALELHAQGRLDQARALYGRLLRRDPHDVRALMHLGALLCQQGRHADGEPLLARAAKLAPDDAGCLLNLGRARQALGRTDGALEAFALAAIAAPGMADPLLRRGMLLAESGRMGEARGTFERLLRAHPDSPDAAFNAGVFFDQIREPGRAAELYEQTLQLAPDHEGALLNLANRARSLGDHARAAALYRQGAERGSATAHSFLLIHRHYLPETTQDGFLAEAKTFAARHADHLAPVPRAARPASEKLRVGLLSGDFNYHAVGSFLEPVLARIDTGAFDIFCYDNSATHDAMSRTMLAHGHTWRSVRSMSDEDAAGTMAADGLDVLMDLGGHTTNGRILATARRPAPVQAVWLGYFNTTGLAAVDWLLADPRTVPEGADGGYVERILRLPHSFLAYAPPALDPPPMPATRPGDAPPVFGCFNDPAKINGEVARAWARILCRVPEARLVLKGHVLATAEGRSALLGRLADAGIDPARAELLPGGSWDEYFNDHARMDIALDTFPYNGGTTTADALWMGVPVVAFAGRTFASRFGHSILSAAGLPELCADDLDGYVDLAVSLADDRAALADLRRGLRQRFLDSPFCDVDGFTRGLEDAWRAMAAGANK